MSELFTSVLSADADFSAFFLCCGVALLCGVPIAAAMTFRTKSSRSFLSSLLLLPPAGTRFSALETLALVRIRGDHIYFSFYFILFSAVFVPAPRKVPQGR